MHFLEIIRQQFIILKTVQCKKCMGFFFFNFLIFFQNCSFFISVECMVTPNFPFGYQEHLLSSAFSV